KLGHESSTVATWLQAAGYRTALIGKYLNGYPAGVKATYVPPGWDEWFVPVRGNPYIGFDYALNENGRVVSYGSRADDYLDDVMTAKASRFIESTASDPKPFFLYLAPFTPHRPATPPPRYRNAFPGAKAPR